MLPVSLLMFLVLGLILEEEKDAITLSTRPKLHTVSTLEHRTHISEFASKYDTVCAAAIPK